MSTMRDALLDLIAHASASDINEPHAVVSIDPQTGAMTVVGPYPDLTEAVTAASRMTDAAPRLFDAPYPTYSIALYCTPEQG